MPESQLVHDYCTHIGLPISLYTPKRIERRNLPLNRQSFVFGDMDCMHGAMRQLKIPIPNAVYYPPSLKRHLHRNVWPDTLTGVRSRIEDGGDPVFAKPSTRAKRFTGRVFSDHSDFYHIEGTSLREPVWCSEVVTWTTEYRVYVNGAHVVGVDHYDGNPSVELDASVIASAIRDYTESGEAPVAYGIDFGVLTTGETALVEANDGFALGAYKIASTPYSELVFARWQQLLETSAGW